MPAGGYRPCGLAAVDSAYGRLLPSQTVLLPQGVAPAGSYPCGWLPPLTGTTGLPFRLALAAADHPLAGHLGRGLAVGGWPPILLIAFAVKTRQERREGGE
ncbi:hypothetical protein B296_00014633 [Ensete ventricosum]|uniref:Uncharacterized protein n=1 Tax=Ensete ventricosum TaxID=4639 RepID=A0A427AJX5_ENSVE|nr:hypothetical protein B296_00014633 [Ensete ventricosum]